MKLIKHFVLFLSALLFISSCADDDDKMSCPAVVKVSAKVNGETVVFQALGRAIDFIGNGDGHTLTLHLISGVYSPQQDSYDIQIMLPYKKTGKNVVEGIRYFRVQNQTSTQILLSQSQIQSKVRINRNTCVSLEFSGTGSVDGTSVTISDGLLEYTYEEPFNE